MKLDSKRFILLTLKPAIYCFRLQCHYQHDLFCSKFLHILATQTSNLRTRTESLKPFIYNFFEYFTNYRKKTNRTVFFSHRLLPNTLILLHTNKTCEQSRKQDSFRHILKNSGSMYGISSSQVLTLIRLGF